jgi:hypothetical protein
LEPQDLIGIGLALTFLAYLPSHKYIYRPTGALWPPESIDALIPSVDKSKASRWLDQNQNVEQMTWVPGEPEVIRDKLIHDGGFVEKAGVACYNLYRAPTIKGGKAAEAGPWLAHVHTVFEKADAEWIIKWCAHRVQYPGEKINHALVLGSDDHGIGKDALLVPVREAIGSWNFSDISPQQALSRFNGYYRAVILRINEGRDLGDVNRYQFYDHMKTATASPPDTLRVDEKYTKEYYIWNCVGVIITTNYKTNGLYLPAEDRRHYVAWSDMTRGDFEDGYWNRLFGWYEAGGIAHVAGYLAGVDISGWDAKAPPPKTEAFWEIVDANKAPENAEMADTVDLLQKPDAQGRLQRPDAFILLDLINEAGMEFSDWLRDVKNRRRISIELKRCGYVSLRNPDRTDGFWLVAGKRQVVYVAVELEYRKQVEAAQCLVEKKKIPDLWRKKRCESGVKPAEVQWCTVLYTVFLFSVGFWFWGRLWRARVTLKRQ